MAQTSSSDSLFKALELAKDADGNFIGTRGPKVNRMTIYGGELMAQALVAAQLTVSEDRRCSALHCYFHLPSSINEPNTYQVSKIRDGRNFSHRWTKVMTKHVDDPNKISLSFQLDCSFRVHKEQKPEFTTKMPIVPEPEECTGNLDFINANPTMGEHIKLFTTYLTKIVPFEFYFTEPRKSFGLDFDEQGSLAVWVRLYPCSLEKSEDFLNKYKEAVLSYICDLFLLQSANRSRQKLTRVLTLNHTMWFYNMHKQLKFDSWLLFHTVTKHVDDGIALVSGSIFLRDGTLLAEMSQQGILEP